MALRKPRRNSVLTATGGEAQSMQRTRSKIPEPDATMYGIFGPSYGRYLESSATSDDPSDQALRVGSAAALREGASTEANLYRDALRRAQDLQSQAAFGENQAGILEKIIENTPQMISRGAGRVFSGAYGEATPYADLFNPQSEAILGQGDRSELNQGEAERIGNIGGATKDFADAGIGMDPVWIQNQVRNPDAPADEASPGVITNYMPPGAVTDRINARTHAQEMEERAVSASGKNSVKVQETVNNNGEVISRTITGPTQQAVDAAKADYPDNVPTNTNVTGPPVTEDDLTPNAGAQSGGASATTAAGKNKVGKGDPGAAGMHSVVYGDLTDYTNPYYDSIEAELEAKYPMLPRGALRAIRMHGERTNANRVSEDNAKTVYQIIPDTRTGLMKNYGIADPWSSPEAAAEGAARHIMESARHGGDWAREYIGGPNWHKRTGKNAQDINEYANRVYSADAGRGYGANKAQVPVRGNRSVTTRVEQRKQAPTKSATQYLAQALKQPGVVKGEVVGDMVVVTMQTGKKIVFKNGQIIGRS